MAKIEFFELPEGHRNTQMENGPEEFAEFSGKELAFIIENIPPGATVLDAGCGEGKHMLALFGKAKRVAGIDTSRAMIERARRNLKGVKNAELRLADAEEMPFADEEFDFIICTRNTFGNFLNREKVLSEMKRVLKPGGKMFMGVYSEHAEELQLRYYRQVGIKITKIAKDCIYAEPDFRSERFTKEKLRGIFGRFGLECEIIPLNRVAYECVVTKK